MNQLVIFYQKKYKTRDTFHVIKSLNYFDDINLSDWPVLLKEKDLTFEKLKFEIDRRVKNFLKNYFKLMIIVKLLGGLGNQMFQYALGRVLSLKHNTQLKFDLRGLYAGEDVRKEFELDIFGIEPLQASRKEYFPFFRETFLGSRKLWDLVKKIKKYKRIRGPKFEFYPEILEHSSPNMYIAGLFQSEKYFKDYEQTIRQDFTFKNPLTNKNLELAIKLKQTNSVSIHIRRGDYINSQKYKNKIGTVPLEFYHKAVEVIKQNVPNPLFIIFSDDPQWAKQNLKLSAQTIIVDWNRGKESYRDIQLMSLCKHNIIANSTFSWWGAWLNQNPQKIVIAPKQWFYGEFQKIYDTKDLIPENWIKL